MATKKIPSIPTHAIDAIADPNVRDALRAMADAMNVMSGNEATRAQQELSAARYSNQLVPSGDIKITPQQVSGIITQLQAQVMESPLFKFLGERVALIDKPGGLFTRLGLAEITLKNEVTARQEADNTIIESVQILGGRVSNAEGVIVEERNLRINADTVLGNSLSALAGRVGTTESGIQTEGQVRISQDNALASAINTVWAAVGDNLALVQSGSSGVANRAGAVATQWSQVQAAVKDVNGNVISSSVIKQTADSAVSATGVITSQYAVRIDTNGYITGYGLIQSQNGPQPQSEFYVRADRFAIGAPNGPALGIAPRIPFIVQTSPTFIQGNYVPAGVYMDAAFIRAATITRAMIGDAEVDTLKIAGNSVMVGQHAEAFGGSIPANGQTILIARQLDLGDSFNSGLIIIGTAGIFTDGPGGYVLEVWVNHVRVGRCGQSIEGGYLESVTATGFASNVGRFPYVELVVRNVDSGPGSGVPGFLEQSTMAIFGGKR